MDASEAIARESIRDVISRYNHAGDRGDLDALVRCFTENGVLDLEREDDLRGRAAIQKHLSGVVADLADRSVRPLLRHHVSSVRIELTGPDTATASCYFLVFTEVGLDHWGRYADRLVRAGDVWQIAHRKVRVDGAALNSRMAREHRIGGGSTG
jgi:ketosteroid isomerase-like protein